MIVMQTANFKSPQFLIHLFPWIRSFDKTTEWCSKYSKFSDIPFSYTFINWYTSSSTLALGKKYLPNQNVFTIFFASSSFMHFILCTELAEYLVYEFAPKTYFYSLEFQFCKMMILAVLRASVLVYPKLRNVFWARAASAHLPLSN